MMFMSVWWLDDGYVKAYVHMKIDATMTFHGTMAEHDDDSKRVRFYFWIVILMVIRKFMFWMVDWMYMMMIKPIMFKYEFWQPLILGAPWPNWLGLQEGILCKLTRVPLLIKW